MTVLILWDVDHTLIENAGVSKQIYASAFEILTGRVPSAEAPTEGRTDRAIMRVFFEGHGLPAPPWPEVDSALRRAGLLNAAALRARGSVLPGVDAVLRRLSSNENVAQSILTGNIRANAVVKLSAFGLDALLDLDLGAYGSDAEERFSLVGVAQRRFEQTRFRPPDRTVLLGDTPRDVEAARTGEAEIVAIASGIHSAAQLRAAGARTVLTDLTDTDAVLAALGLAAGTAAGRSEKSPP